MQKLFSHPVNTSDPNDATIAELTSQTTEKQLECELNNLLNPQEDKEQITISVSIMPANNITWKKVYLEMGEISKLLLGVLSNY